MRIYLTPLYLTHAIFHLPVAMSATASIFTDVVPVKINHNREVS